MLGFRILPVLALFMGGMLLASDLFPNAMHSYVSALPLALAGIGYAILQIRMKPDPGTLAKRLLLAATFIMWAVDQLLPPGRIATVLGDVVIAAYVLDLYWLMEEQITSVKSGAG